MKTPSTMRVIASFASVVASIAGAVVLIVMTGVTQTQASVQPAQPAASVAAPASAASQPNDAGICVLASEKPANVYRCSNIVVTAKRDGSSRVASTAATPRQNHL